MIYVECKPDFLLVRSVTNVSKREIVHELGKSNVCKRLQKDKNCKGLIDEDPSAIQPRYVREATPEDNFSEHGIKLLRGGNGNHLIVLCPRLEEWVLKAANEAGIDVAGYDLPNDAGRLHKEINISLDKFEKLLKDLKDSSSRLKTLKRLLEEKL